MGRYRKLIQPVPVPQSKPLPNRPEMVANDAGGYVFKSDDFNQLKRFLVLGTEGGSYYVSAKELTARNIEVVRRCLAQDGFRTIDIIREISNKGLAPKNTPAILALALCAIFGENQHVKSYAYQALPDVCRTATHLFQFLEFRYSDAFGKNVGGFGRGLRKAVSHWYLSKSSESLAYQLIKYRQREGWTHRDVLRLAHPEPLYNWQSVIFKWVIDGTYPEDIDDIIQAYEKAKTAKEPEDIAALISEYNLPREAIPTEFLKEKVVWSALLKRMPLTAMLRNLGNMSKADLLKPLSQSEKIVVEAFTHDAIKKARIHPISILLALKTYAQGKGFKSDNSWPVNQTIVDMLDEAFYAAFDNVEPTGKRIMLALDVSGSMSSQIAGIPLMNSEVSAAFAMLFKRVEKTAHVLGFSGDLIDLGITPRMRLGGIMRKISNLTFGRTDCALPMIHALKNKMEVDVFIIITDNETWHGRTHPAVALENYRHKMNIPDAKLIVLATSSNGFTIADPQDKNMLDIVGFSADVLDVVNNFIRGEF